MLGELLPALARFADPGLLGILAGGVGLGLFVGATPGLTATLAIALLLPFTFHLPVVEALVMLTGIYIGGIFGGAITAITIRIPGAPANTMTILDGNAMAKAGRPEVALGLATFSSFVGGVVGGIVLVGFAPQLARVALEFQSPETFSLVLLALIAVATVNRENLVKGLAATLVGLMLSTVGLDKMLPVTRFTMGSTNLLVGVPLLPVVIGLFALTEFFWQTGEVESRPTERVGIRFNRVFDFWPEAKRVGWKLFAKSSAIGAFVGALPGGGAAMGAFLAYTEAKRSSQHPERFGTGIAEGIVAPETANNAVTGGAFIPMLAFGIPGDAVTAVILGGLMIQGVSPGLRLFRESGDLILPLFIGYFLAYGLVLLLGFALLPWYSSLARVDRAVLFPFIAAVSLVAAFVAQRTMFGMWLTLGIGVMGYLLRRFGYPLVPVLLGLLLGPMLESNFRRSLIVSEQGPLIFITSPVSAVLLLAAACLLLYFGFLQPRRQRGNESNQKI
jgi:putative tricarboxylic transport membrane protein